MRPNTPHYVVTLENSITWGRHFYCRSTIADHAWGLVHTGLVEHVITNTVHREIDTVCRRMLDRAIQDYFDVSQGKREVDGKFYSYTRARSFKAR
jgi:hypothetical protein